MPTQNVILVASGARQGTFVSGAVQAPPTILGVRFILTLRLVDKLAVGLTASLHIERSLDGVTDWLPVAGFGWTSYGPGGYKDNPDPSLSFNPQGFPDQFFRVVLDLPQSLIVGATVAITT